MYSFKTKPYDHQQVAFKNLGKPRTMRFSWKWAQAKQKLLWTRWVRFLRKAKLLMRLVVAPKGVFDNWVQLEIPAHLPERIKRYVVRWQPNFTKKYKEELLGRCCPGPSCQRHVERACDERRSIVYK
jgi:hypothetical protein